SPEPMWPVHSPEKFPAFETFHGPAAQGPRSAGSSALSKQRIALMNALTKVIGTSLVAVSLMGCTANAETGSNKMAAASSEQTVMVGGAPMYPSKNIIENAVNSKDHETLVAAVKAAG